MPSPLPLFFTGTSVSQPCLTMNKEKVRTNSSRGTHREEVLLLTTTKKDEKEREQRSRCSILQNPSALALHFSPLFISIITQQRPHASNTVHALLVTATSLALCRSLPTTTTTSISRVTKQQKITSQVNFLSSDAAPRFNSTYLTFVGARNWTGSVVSKLTRFLIFKFSLHS